MSHLRLLAIAAFSAVLSCAGCGGTLGDAGPGAGPENKPASQQDCGGPPYPIVLAHGMAGWDKIGAAWNYFYQVAGDLGKRGERVYTAQVSPFDDSVVRGAQLAQQIEAARKMYGACKVDVIAHSQGGIDARYAISALGLGDRVAALVTVATPHRGTPVADVALGLIPGLAYPVADAVLLAYEAIVGAPPGSPGLKAQLRQLSMREMEGRFNPAYRDDARVAYYSVAGRSSLAIDNAECASGLWANPPRGDVLDILFSGAQLVFALRDPLSPDVNDGLVPVSSSRWGTFLGCVPADHLDEIGQFFLVGPDLVSGFDHLVLYRNIASQLHRDGF